MELIGLWQPFEHVGLPWSVEQSVRVKNVCRPKWLLIVVYTALVNMSTKVPMFCNADYPVSNTPPRRRLFTKWPEK
jgi:hypothetical protein